MMIWLVLLTAVGCGLMGGVFFAFSSFVLPALGSLPTTVGIAAMQRINQAVVPSSFLIAFLVTTLFAMILGTIAALHLSQPVYRLLLAASLCYLLGVFLVTVVANVPLNDRLAAVSAESVDAVSLWQTYQQQWAFWNHVRTAASVASLCGYLFVLRFLGSR